MVKRFAAQQPGVDGQPLYYLIEYAVVETEGRFVYEGRGYITKDFNKELTSDDEAFYYSFERTPHDWSVISNIQVGSALGEKTAQKIRDTIFRDLVLSGTMGFEQRQSNSTT